MQHIPIEEENLLSLAFTRFYEAGSLYGTPESCLSTVEKFAAIGVDEIACLIDFGIDFDTTMRGLEHLARLVELADRRHGTSPGLEAKYDSVLFQ